MWHHSLIKYSVRNTYETSFSRVQKLSDSCLIPLPHSVLQNFCSNFSISYRHDTDVWTDSKHVSETMLVDIGLRNMIIHHHYSPQLDTKMSQFNIVYILTTYSTKSILILSSNLHLVFIMFSTCHVVDICVLLYGCYASRPFLNSVRMLPTPYFSHLCLLLESFRNKFTM
jgi:hypothetical protein